MKTGAIPESIAERLVLAAGLAPTPVVDTFHAVIVARAIMVATRIGVFDAVASGARSASDLAADLGVDTGGLTKLANLLVTLGYLRSDGHRYAATRLSSKWLRSDSPQSLRDNMLLRFLEWQAIETMEDFVRTGKALDVHDLISGDQWDVYQRGMRALAKLSAGEVAGRVALRRGARAMLDIGGGHGAYSSAFCERYQSLNATILDLPEAVHAAMPLAAEGPLRDGRLTYRAGDALSDDLGQDQWDLIFIAHLVHHFAATANRDLVARSARALRPGGVLATLDVLRVESSGTTTQTGALLDLYFAITSNSGTWSEVEVNGWSLSAGLQPKRTLRLRTAPGISVVVATKSGPPA